MTSELHRMSRRSGPARPQSAVPSRGAATLVVVMVLFFLVAMVAAYTNRSLIFDQRTSTNQLRATQAFEAAEAGVEWTLAQLNAGLVNNSCAPSTTTADSAHMTFRDRYFRVTPTINSGALIGMPHGGVLALNHTALHATDPTLQNTPIWTRCVFDGSDPKNGRWNCTCGQRDVDVSTPARPAGNQPAPAFAVYFADQTAANVDVGPLPRTVTRIVSIGCSQVTNCFDRTPGADSGSSVAAIYTHVALRPALRTQPSSALTLRGNLNALPAGGFASGASMRLVNDPQVAIRVGRTPVTRGLTVVTGGTAATANLDSVSMPGTPGVAAVAQGDATLVPAAIAAASFPPSGLSSQDRFFVLHMGMTPEQYRNQPATVVLDCSTACDAAKIRTAVERNPGSPLWLTGGGGLLLDGNIGEVNNASTKSVATGPVMLIVEQGPVSATDGVEFWGVIYGRSADWTWTVAGTVSIKGAILGEGNFTLAAGGTPPQLLVDYSDAQQQGVFNFLRVRAGSYTRVLSGWRDWYAE